MDSELGAAMSGDHKRTEGMRTTRATAGSISYEGWVGEDIKFKANPDYIKARQEVWDEVWAEQQAAYASFPREEIKVTMPDGNVKEGKSFETTPLDIAKKISNQLAKKVLVAKVKFQSRVATLDEGLTNTGPETEEGEEGWILYDLTRPLEGDC
jgi:hypothetical protein